MRGCKILFVMVAIGLLPHIVSATMFDDVALHGSLKSLNLYSETPLYRDHDITLSSNHIRFDLTGRVTSLAGFEVSLDQQILWANRTGVVSLSDNFSNRFFDLEKNWREDRQLSGQLQVDRLNVYGELGDTHWSVGRQAVGFGRISLFSPLDIIAPFPPDALDVDVRPGVDAVRLTHYFGMAGQLGGIAVFSEENNKNSYLLTFSENLLGVDVLAIGGVLRDRSLFGIGVAGEVGKLGLKAEISCYEGVDVGQPHGDRDDDFQIGAVEGWYRFENGLILLGEYLFNGIGSNTSSEYPLVATTAPIEEGLSFLLGRHYLLLGPSYQFHPLVTANGLVILNLKDHSSMIRPQMAISLADNLQLDLFYTLTLGKKTELDPYTQIPIVRSEFGSMGDSVGLLLRWYF